jgi:hypothetical protein
MVARGEANRNHVIGWKGRKHHTPGADYLRFRNRHDSRVRAAVGGETGLIYLYLRDLHLRVTVSSNSNLRIVRHHSGWLQNAQW